MLAKPIDDQKFFASQLDEFKSAAMGHMAEIRYLTIGKHQGEWLC